MVKIKIPGFISYERVIDVIAISLSTLLLAKTINVTIGERFDRIKEPKAKAAVEVASIVKNNNKATNNVIDDRNIFDSSNLAKAMQEKEKEKERVNVAGEGPVVKSSLDAELIGTIVISNPRYSVATVRYRNETNNYYIGEKIENATITIISRKYIEILRDDQREFIEIPDEDSQKEQAAEKEPTVVSETSSLQSGIVKKGEDKFEIARERLEAALSDMSSILKQARAIPYMVGSKTEGFKIVAIRPKSIYQELGIRNGDIIQRVNGKELDSVESVLTVFQSLKSEAGFTIDIKRRGESKSYMYSVK